MLWLVKNIAFCFFLALVSCSEEGGKNSGGGGDRGGANQEPRPPKTCFDGTIKKILPNGSHALVQSNNSRNENYLWDFVTGFVEKDIVPIFNLDTLNDSGQLLLRSYDNVRFLVQETKDSRGGFRESRLFPRGSNPVVKFSHSNDHLITTRRSGSSIANRVEVFDIFERKTVWQATFNRIVSAVLKDRTRGAVVTSTFGGYQLNLIDPSKNRIDRGIRLPGRGFNRVEFSRTAIVVMVGSHLYSFDADSGNLNTKIKISQLLDIDKLSDFALISTRSFQYWVIDLKTGGLVKKLSLSSRDRLSTCQLNYGEKFVACVEPSRVSTIKFYSIDNKEDLSLCLLDSP